MADDTDNSPSTDTSLSTSRVSRRALVKGAAVVGGSVWVAPTIESVVSSASASPLAHCAPAGKLTLSGMTVIYYRNVAGTPTLYWTFISEHAETCGNGSIDNDSSFTEMCGTNTLSVNTPIAGVEWNGVRPGDHDPAGCPFEGTATGARLLAGTTGITVLAWIAHDGSFSSTGGVGDPHHDFKFACGTIDPDCANFPIT